MPERRAGDLLVGADVQRLTEDSRMAGKVGRVRKKALADINGDRESIPWPPNSHRRIPCTVNREATS